MGDVYRARDVRLGRDVAIKVMAEHVAADPEMRRRFELEVRAVAALSHPNILGHPRAGDHQTACRSPSWSCSRARRCASGSAAGALPWREAVEIARARSPTGSPPRTRRGIVHRDLKPENIFLTADGARQDPRLRPRAAARSTAPSVADDSPTRRAHRARASCSGTFGYMSPEQVTGGRVDGRSDIFALGCVLYEMLAGRRLFAGPTPQRDDRPPAARQRAGSQRARPAGAAGARAIVVARASPAIRPALRIRAGLAMALRALETGSSPASPRDRRAARRAASRSRCSRSSTPGSTRRSST